MPTDTPLERVRAAVEAWRVDEARERILRWRGAADASTPSGVAARHAWLAGPEPAEILGRLVAASAVDEGSGVALRLHLARARAEAELAEVRDRIEAGVATVDPELDEALARLATADGPSRELALHALTDAARAAVPRLLAARARADRAGAEGLGTGPQPVDAGLPVTELVAEAEALLEATEPLADEALTWTLRRAGTTVRDPRLADLLFALREPSRDGAWPSRGRFHRVARAFDGLGFGAVMNARMTVAGTHGALDFRPRLAVVDAPLDVRIGASSIELGLASELSAADAVGRALAACLTAPALPVELRRPVIATVARAIGTVSAQLHADTVYVRRAVSTRSEREARTRRAAALLLFETRVAAAAVVGRASASRADERVVAGAARLREALKVSVPEPLAALVVATPAALGPRFRGRSGGLALSVALRERFDEDWFVNPRAKGPLRAACERAGGLSVEALCEELGGAARGAIAAARLTELWG